MPGWMTGLCGLRVIRIDISVTFDRIPALGTLAQGYSKRFSHVSIRGHFVMCLTATTKQLFACSVVKRKEPEAPRSVARGLTMVIHIRARKRFLHGRSVRLGANGNSRRVWRATYICL